MTCVQTASEVLDQTYLQLRAKLLELAAGLDRIERADSGVTIADDPRVKGIQEGIGVLSSRGLDRSERIQMIFSDPYDTDWNK